MTTRERPIDRGRRLATADRIRIGHELRVARQILGRSLDSLGRASGMSASQVGRIERGVLSSVTVDQLARVGAVVGLDVRVRSYPGPDPLLDAGQVAIIRRLRQRIDPALPFRTEVVLPTFGDQRAWDALIGGLRGGAAQLPVDADTRLVDSQAQIRRMMLKLRDSGFDSVLWVLADTHANRDAVSAGASTILPDFPVSARKALAALAAGQHPGGSALVLI